MNARMTSTRYPLDHHRTDCPQRSSSPSSPNRTVQRTTEQTSEADTDRAPWTLPSVPARCEDIRRSKPTILLSLAAEQRPVVQPLTAQTPVGSTSSKSCPE